jgi:AcrR family transcriptional regulator
LSARQVRKEATRQRVLDAARGLFESVGYEGTTVRMIARAAGVSVGSVFTTFKSKREVLSHILHERLDGLHGELNHVASQLRGSTADRLRSIFAIHFATTFDGPGEESEEQRQDSRLWKILHGCLEDGRTRGEVCPHVDITLVTDLLLAAYVWTYRLVAREDADVDALSQVMDRHIGLIADGFTPRPDAAA